MERKKVDIAVIGSGPGGYVAAIRAAQRGLTTCLIEARETGGTCLNRGCIPSKALISSAELLHQMKTASKHGIHVEKLSFDYKSMAKRKDEVVDQIRSGLTSLIKSNKITLIQGYGSFASPNQIKVRGKDECLIEADQIILATGSEPREIPSLAFDYSQVHDSTSLLELTKLPKSLLIVGGGVIGCEFACLHNAFGVEVTIVELLPSILSTEGSQVANTMAKALQEKGIKIITNAVVTKLDKKKDHVTIHLEDERILQAESVLVSVGRKYNTDAIGLEKTGVIVNPDGSIPTNEKMQTNVPHIYAIGDITARWILAHVASHQGLIAADNAAGISCVMHYNAVPSVIFTHPEVATIGYTLERALEEGYDATLGAFPFQALGKAKAAGETEGFAQVVIAKSTGQILGAQVVGHSASTLIAEMAVAISAELTVDSINETIHAHPTIAEAWMEAAFIANDLPLHLPPRAS